MTTTLATPELLKLLDNDEEGTIRSMLLNFPDDLNHLDRDEHDDTDTFDAALPILHKLADNLELAENWAKAMERDALTDIALSLSLCPMHLIDYAICFDDNDAECAILREYHPLHDT